MDYFFVKKVKNIYPYSSKKYSLKGISRSWGNKYRSCWKVESNYLQLCSIVFTIFNVSLTKKIYLKKIKKFVQMRDEKSKAEEDTSSLKTWRRHPNRPQVWCKRNLSSHLIIAFAGIFFLQLHWNKKRKRKMTRRKQKRKKRQKR